MKISINIDCTPEEARQFFGLPDLKPIQEAVLAEMQNRMSEAVSGMSGEEMMKQWMPAGMQGMEALQKMFFQAANFGGQETPKD